MEKKHSSVQCVQLQSVWRFKVPPEKGLFKCTVCPSTFIQSRDLRWHLRTHSGDKPLECTVHVSLNVQSFSYYHLTTRSDKKPLKCTVCCQSYQFIQQWTEEMRGSSKCDAYRECKRNLKFESYLTNLLKVPARYV